MKGANASYWTGISDGFSSLWTGLKLAFGHLWDARHSRTPVGVDAPDYFSQTKGIVTLQYPHESLPLPDNARYRLHNEIDDCIVCDKCAKICPVDCIDIEPIKSPEEIGKTSDGTPKRLYAAKFDIDMAKCCFCGLCTTVCPTECLTMTKAYDFSEFDVKDHNYAFAEMTPLQILEARQKLEEAEKAKAAQKEALPTSEASSATAKPMMARPKPVARPTLPPVEPAEAIENVDEQAPKRPVFKPRVPPTKGTPTTGASENAPTSEKKDGPETNENPRPKVIVRPRPEPKKTDNGDQ